MAVAPQLQWSIDNTAGSIWQVGRSLIQAATSDNIQPLALLACESFGATLPVSPITRIKVEKLSRQCHSEVLSFAKAQIGYRPGDSADILSRTDGGVRFLCFTAILSSWGVNQLYPAELLQQLLHTSATQGQPLPTLLQIRDLLQALRPKLLHSGFTNDLLGWSQFCVDPNTNDQLITEKALCITPGVEEFAALVEGLRRCYRLGDANEMLRIECGIPYVPWTITVVKWLVGSPPTVQGLDGHSIILSGDSTVLVYMSDLEGRFMVTSIKKVGAIEEVISTSGYPGPGYGIYSRVGGSIDVSVWFRLRLETLQLEPRLAIPVVRCAIRYLPAKVVLCRTIALDTMEPLAENVLPCAFPDLPFRLAIWDRMTEGIPDQTGNELDFGNLFGGFSAGNAL
jgi:hypothetical protein